jgi:integrase
MKLKLTKRSVESLPPGLHWDTEVPGFGCRVSEAGTRAFILQYRFNGRQTKKNIGKFPLMRVDEARRIAFKWAADLQQGKPPVEVKEEGKYVSDACARYLREVSTGKKPKTQELDKVFVDKWINPHMGHVKVADLTSADISRLHFIMRDRPSAANRAVSLLQNILTHCETWGLRPQGTNPAHRVKRNKEVARSRYLSVEEFKRLSASLDHFQPRFPNVVNLLRLLMLTGARRGEIMTLRWNDIRDGVIHLRDSKTGPRTLHVGQAARKMLGSMPRVSEWVIPGHSVGQPLKDPSPVWRKIRDHAELGDFTIHDLRHSFASMAVNSGGHISSVGVLLGHTKIQTTKRYSHHTPDVVQAEADRVSALISNLMMSR